MTDVFILGAGFSKAIGNPMPVTNDLALRVIDAQKSIHASERNTHSDICDDLSCDYPVLPRKGRDRLDFELWLSKLAEPQPYLYAPANMQRLALFQKLTGLIAIQINDAVQMTVGSHPVPDWLARLIAAWHKNETNVITFNYDTLVETTFDSVGIFTGVPKGSYEQIGPLPLAIATSYDGWPVQAGKTLSLIKLHGSTHLYWDETTRSAESITPIGIRSKWLQRNPEYVDGSVRAPGKVPLIVPPIVAKSTFFENTYIRELWHHAYEALRGANRLFAIGYSLPPADLLVRALLEEGLGDESEIWVVNPDRDGEVEHRFTALSENVHLDFCGSTEPPRSNLLGDFVTWYTDGMELPITIRAG